MLYVFATSLGGIALGPVVVAGFTDLVFGDETKLGFSIAPLCGPGVFAFGTSARKRDAISTAGAGTAGLGSAGPDQLCRPGCQDRTLGAAMVCRHNCRYWDVCSERELRLVISFALSTISRLDYVED